MRCDPARKWDDEEFLWSIHNNGTKTEAKYDNVTYKQNPYKPAVTSHRIPVTNSYREFKDPLLVQVTLL